MGRRLGGKVENEQNIGGKKAESVNMWAEKRQMGTMLEFITRMGYHFRQKIGRNRRIL